MFLCVFARCIKNKLYSGDRRAYFLSFALYLWLHYKIFIRPHRHAAAQGENGTLSVGYIFDGLPVLRSTRRRIIVGELGVLHFRDISGRIVLPHIVNYLFRAKRWSNIDQWSLKLTWNASLKTSDSDWTRYLWKEHFGKFIRDHPSI